MNAHDKHGKGLNTCVETDLLRRLEDGRLSVLGVGNRLRHDDGVGSLLAERLASMTGVTVVDAGMVPENHLEQLLRSQPDTIVIVDAVDFGGTAGEVRILEPSALPHTGLSTHAPSLNMAVEYLRNRTQARVWVLGIQPTNLGLGEGLSPSVSLGAHFVEQAFVRALSLRPVTTERSGCAP